MYTLSRLHAKRWGKAFEEAVLLKWARFTVVVYGSIGDPLALRTIQKFKLRSILQTFQASRLAGDCTSAVFPGLACV
jgi:hypothetical protein